MGKIDALVDQLDALPDNALAERIRILHDIRKLRLEFIGHLEQMETAMRELNRWYERITVKQRKAKLTHRSNDVERTPERVQSALPESRASAGNRQALRHRQGSFLVPSTDPGRQPADQGRPCLVHPIQPGGSQRHSGPAQSDPPGMPRALPAIPPGHECLDRQLSPNTFISTRWVPLLEGLEKMAERARKAIDLPAPVMPAGQRSKKVFMTEDDHGDRGWNAGNRLPEAPIHLTGQGGVKEIWEQAAKRQVSPAQPTAADRSPRAQGPGCHGRRGPQPACSRSRPTEAKIEAYAAQDMLPVDLEHMIVSGQRLSRRALDIGRCPTESRHRATA